MPNLHEMRSQIGRNVCLARQRAGFKSQRQLASLLSFSHTKLSAIERGESTASHEDLREIAHCLSVPVEALLAMQLCVHEKIVEIESLLRDGSAENLTKARILAIQLPRHTRDAEQLCYVLNLLGRILLKQGFFKKANSCYRAMLKVSDRTRGIRHRFDALFRLALSDFYAQNYVQSFEFAKEAQKCAENEFDRNKCLHLQGNIYAETLYLKQASICLHKALPFYVENGHIRETLQVQHSIGDVHLKLGEIESAIEYFVLARKSAFANNDHDAICKTTIDLSEAYFSADPNNYCETVSKMIEDVFFHQISCTDRQRSAMVYWRSKCIGSLEQRLAELEKAYSFIESLDDRDLRFRITCELGETYEKLGDSQSALKYYKLAAFAKK